MSQALRVCALACLCACSSATIYRHDAPDLEATIVGGSADYLYVETEDERVVRLNRKKITEIDHPGNAEALIGGILLAEGAAIAGVGLTANDADTRAVMTTSGLSVGIPGLLMLVHGLLIWNRSTDAAAELTADFPLRFPPPPPVALALPATPTALPLPVTPLAP